MNIKSIHDPISKPIAGVIIAAAVILCIIATYIFKGSAPALVSSPNGSGRLLTAEGKAELVRLMTATSSTKKLTPAKQKLLRLMTATASTTKSAKKLSPDEMQELVKSMTAKQ